MKNPVPLIEIERMIRDAENELIRIGKDYDNSQELADCYNTLIWHLTQIKKETSL